MNRRPVELDDAADMWPDVSVGPFHQTIRWSPEWIAEARAAGVNPSVYPGDDTIARIGARYLDNQHAIAVAMPKLQAAYATATDAGGDLADAASYYNKPNMDPADNRNRAAYATAIEQARLILDGSPVADVLGP